MNFVTDNRKSILVASRWAVPAVLASIFAQTGVETALAAIVSGDPLEVAIAPPNDSVNFKENSFEVFAADTLSYDDNIYRLPSRVTDLQSLSGIGANATRTDHINTITLGTDAVWNVGRQNITADLRVDDNRFKNNTNLDNYSSNDKLIWNWSIGSVLSGAVGATYSSALVSFVNSAFYARDQYAVANYYGAGRYQLGPRWAIFGGVLESRTTLSDSALRLNDLNTTSVDFGTEFATGVKDSLGLEYRYTDARFPLGTAALNNDYREDTARFVVRHAFSEKTKVDASVGFLKRDYTSRSIASFSGDIWRIAAQWQPTDKLQFGVDGWRNLQAYVTSQSDYYVSNGGRIAPQWAASEKITVIVSAAYEVQNYIGFGLGAISQVSRRDTLSTSEASIKYTPFKFLTFDFAYAYEKRNSNESQFQFNDNVISAKVTVKR